jgi:hypothetical protein
MFEKQTTVTPFVNNLEVELYLKHEIPGSTVWMQYRLSIGACIDYREPAVNSLPVPWKRLKLLCAIFPLLFEHIAQ